VLSSLPEPLALSSLPEPLALSSLPEPLSLSSLPEPLSLFFDPLFQRCLRRHYLAIIWRCLSSTACSRRLPRLGSNCCLSVDRTSSFVLLFLGVCSGRPGLRGGGADLLRREADRLNI
jgi:hypothetical protein